MNDIFFVSYGCSLPQKMIKMINGLLLLIEKHSEMLIEQTKTKPQQTFEIKLSKPMESFSYNPSII